MELGTRRLQFWHSCQQNLPQRPQELKILFVYIFPTLKFIPAYLNFRFDTLLGYFLVKKPTIILLFRVPLLPREVRKDEQTLKVFLTGVSGRPSEKSLSKVLDFFCQKLKIIFKFVSILPPLWTSRHVKRFFNRTSPNFTMQGPKNCD